MRGTRLGDPVFSPDGRRILAGFLGDAKIAVWDTASGRLVATANEPRAQEMGGFQPGGTRFVSFNEIAGFARIWDTESLRPLLTLRIGNNAQCFQFAPDGNRLVYVQGVTVHQLDTRSSRRLEGIMNLFEIGERIGAVGEPLERYIREKAKLEAPVQRAALQLIRAFGAWETEEPFKKLLSPAAGPSVYEDLLARVRRVAAVEPSSGDTLNALGAALYRVGRFQEAVATLEHCAQDLRECDPRGNAAFLAMAQARLGRQREAETLLARLRSMPQPSKPEEHELLREVESVVASGRGR